MGQLVGKVATCPLLQGMDRTVSGWERVEREEERERGGERRRERERKKGGGE